METRIALGFVLWLVGYAAVSMHYHGLGEMIYFLTTMPLFLIAAMFLHRENTPRIISATYEKEIMTVEYSDGNIIEYKGSATVWHALPYMSRCGTGTESELSRIYNYIQHYGNNYPDAHKTQQS